MISQKMTELDLIDAGAIDFDGNIILVEPNDLNNLVKKIEDMGLSIIRSELVLRSNNPMMLNSEEEVEKIMDMVEELGGK